MKSLGNNRILEGCCSGATGASNSKLKCALFLFMLLYIFYLRLTFDHAFVINSGANNVSLLIITQFPTTTRKIHEHSEAPPVRVRLINYNLRNMGPADSNDEIEFLLNIRKLIVFAVHELNRPLTHTDCVKWWANPLDLIYYEEVSKSDTHMEQLIKFYVQPGNIRFQVKIQQQFPPIEVEDVELEVVGSFEPLTGFPLGTCHGVSGATEKTCLCSTAKELVEMEKLSMELREMWNSTDPELITWHPDQSFAVEDYMNFTDYDWFVTSPGETKKEIEDNNYSAAFCGPNLKMLVMISSNPHHDKHRKIIRETYASQANLEGKQVKVVFLMGVPTDQKLQESVLKETAEYKDIIQANFGDSYHNLTISHLSMYKWAHLTCASGESKDVTVPKHILKADDDFLLNIDLALLVAQANPDVEFMGCMFCGTKTIRNIAYMTKYYTPRYMHISESYAGYLSGVVYLMRTDVIPRMLHMSVTTPMIHMDDAYITGILVRRLKIYPRNSRLITYGRTEPDACKSKQMVSSYVLSLEDMTEQWKKFIEPAPANCTLNSLELKVQDLDDRTKKYCFYE